MLILLFSTILLVGPAWCSYLCYLGSWDQIISELPGDRRKFLSLPSRALRLFLLSAILLMALFFYFWQIEYRYTVFASLFFIILTFVAFFGSYKNRSMFHCTRFCPIGLITNFVGRINPIRMRIDDSCTLCGHCVAKCRYDALNMERVKYKRPASSCSLCADCLEVCDSKSIAFYFGNKGQKKIEKIFFMLIISLHVIFLGVARI